MMLALLSACTTTAPSPKNKPDVLVVVIDTLRADALSAYGNTRSTTPQMDLLAESGVLFTDVTFPASWTWPGHASLFTGEPHWVNGARTRTVQSEGISGDDDLASVTPMRTDIPTFADLFSAEGYRTVASSQNSWLDPSLGLMRGFDHAEVKKGPCIGLWDSLNQTVSQSPDQPHLVLVNLMEPHAPWSISPVP